MHCCLRGTVVQARSLPARGWSLLASALVLSFVSACSGLRNPSFPITVEEADVELAEMEASPRPLARPLVIVGGFADPGWASGAIRDAVAPCFSNDPIVTFETFDAESFDQARRQLVDLVMASYPDPGGDPMVTAEVDVIGNSMGGLVALYASEPRPGEPRLRTVRLFTIGTPFMGSVVADMAPINGLVRDMQGGSPFLLHIHELVRGSGVTIVPYVRHDDAIVGAANAAPPGTTVWWVPGEFMASGHLTTFNDRRILADVVRRLRDEPGYTREPPTPLPEIGDPSAGGA